MPWLSTPLSGLEPICASGAFMPTRTLGAPQTTCTVCFPVLTRQTVSRSALGCFSTDTTSPTTTGAVRPPPSAWYASTSRPAIVSLSASACPESFGSQKLLSQLSGTFMRFACCSGELLQEAQVAVEEQAQVLDAVAEHGQALEAGAEGEADVLLRVEAEVAHHLGMHLSRAGDLEPAAFQLHVDLGRRLGEREERRPEAHLEVVDLEEAAQEVG